MSRLSRRDRRASILDAARKALSKRGFLGTRAEDIARAAGVSAALLFRYFPTLRAIQRAVLARELRRSPLPPPELRFRGHPAAALKDLAVALGEIVARDPDGVRLAIYASLTDLPGSTRLLRRTILQVERSLAGLLGAWRSEGWVDPKVDAAGLARMLSHALLFEAVTGVLLHPGRRADGFGGAIDGVAALLRLADEPERGMLATVPGRVEPETTPAL